MSSGIPCEEGAGVLRRPAFEDFSLFVLYGSQFWFGACMSALNPTVIEAQRDWPMTYTVVGAYPSVLAASTVVSGAGYLRCVRRWGRPRVLTATAVGVAGSGLLFALAVGPVMLFVAAACLGLFNAPVQTAVIAALEERGKAGRPRRLAGAALCASVGSLTGSSFVAVMASTGIGWRAAWVVLAAAFVVLAVLLPRCTRAVGSRDDEKSGSEARLPPRYWLMATGVMAGVSGEVCIGFFAPRLSTTHGYPSAALVLALYYSGEVCGRVAALCSSLRPSREQRALGICLALSLTGSAVFLLPGPEPWRLIGLVVAAGGIANLFPLGVSAASGAAPGATDRAVARVQLLVATGTFCAPVLLGTLADRTSLHTGLALVPLCFLVMAALLATAGFLKPRAPTPTLAGRPT
ncbi:MFS transporter [Embleya scabrispora]|nr:MFS transporter [Embleya scabrispora]